jgi:hypothetical protein
MLFPRGVTIHLTIAGPARVVSLFLSASACIGHVAMPGQVRLSPVKNR